MELKNNTEQEKNVNQKQDNGIFGIIALFLILIIGFSIQSLLALLSESHRIIDTLWEPSERALFFTGPTFVFICLITVWILAPKASQMKYIFKISND